LGNPSNREKCKYISEARQPGNYYVHRAICAWPFVKITWLFILGEAFGSFYIPHFGILIDTFLDIAAPFRHCNCDKQGPPRDIATATSRGHLVLTARLRAISGSTYLDGP
jgi:hypothetical protein